MQQPASEGFFVEGRHSASEKLFIERIREMFQLVVVERSQFDC